MKKMLKFIVYFLVILLSGCILFESVDQPTSALPGEIITVSIDVTTEGGGYTPYFGVCLPNGWTIQGNSIPCTGVYTGTIYYDISVTSDQENASPAPEGYYWWAGAGEAVYTDSGSVNGQFEIQTDNQLGLFSLDYMLGNSYDGVNQRRSNNHLIGVVDEYTPGGLQAIVEENSVVLNWQAPSITEGLLGYNIYLDEQQINTTLIIDVTFIDEEPLNGVHYYAVSSLYDDSSEHLIPYELPVIFGDFYVSPDGNNANSGLSFDDAFLTINYAMSIIALDPSHSITVFLAPGVYSSSTNGEQFPISFINYVSIIGSGEDVTILDAENQNTVLEFIDVLNTSVEDLTITNGSGYNGGGIYCDNSSPSLVNVVIANNSADGDGGGIYCYHNSNQSLVNVVLANNSANVDGGGICCYDSSPSLQNVTISGNSASSTGGGITCKTTSYPRLENIPISGNSASQYGGCGITCRNVSNPSLFNVTISGNTAGSGGGIYCAESSLSLINSILWNNLPPEIGTYSSSVTATYSDIEGGWEGEGNIDEDPLFVNPIEGDFHLTEDSPCIDAGDPFCPPDPDGTRADMGAYYFHHIGEEEVYADFYADTTIAYMPLPVNFYDLSVAFNTEITTWLWDFDNDGTIDSYEQNPSYIYQNPGYYSVSLTVEDDIGNSNTMIKTDYIAVYPPAYSGNIFHISPEGSNDIGNGSPEYPFATIQHGIFVAENGDTVMVHQGTYPENINYNGKNIIIGSLFLTTQDTTYISQTIIDGSQDGSVVTFESGEDSTAVLIGFIITNGSAVQGGGIYCYNSSPRLENVTIIGNTAADNGGGIYCNDNSNPKLMNVTIIGNSSYYGGGIYCYNSDSCLIDVMIIGNTATIFGGGIYCWQSSPCLENVTISCNSANHGGGISCSNNSSPSLVNVVIANNSAVNVGGGIYCHDSSPILENVTITDNSALYYGGGGIWCYNNSNPTLVNCILWNDTPEEIYYLTSTVTATYSDIQGGWQGTGNIDDNPLFVGAGEHPYSLLEDSPCIDAGIPDTTGLNLPPWDIIGNLRIWDGDGDGIAIIDMGAYEYGAPPYVDVDDCQLSIVNCQFYNYPNPFNPFTIIKFTTENTEKNTELVIYNLKGQKVKTLVNEQLQQGGHSIIWNGRDSNGKRVGSGIYFYKLKTGDFQKVKKMILLR